MGKAHNAKHAGSEQPFGRPPVPEGLPADLPLEERRAARMRLVAGRRLCGLAVVLDGLHDPHNISAALRSCDGFGVQHIHLIGRRSELPISRIVACGCQKWLSLHYYASAAECADALHAQGFALWAAMPDRAAVPVEEIAFSRKVALVFGAERPGISREMVERCDGKYFIPMAGFVESFNVSVAVAVSLYAATRARRQAVGHAGDLTAAEADALAQSWVEADAARKRRGRGAEPA